VNFLKIKKEQINNIYISKDQDDIMLNSLNSLSSIKNEYNIGRLLLEFLYYYGQEFDNNKDFIYLGSFRNNTNTNNNTNNNNIFNMANIKKVNNIKFNKIKST
jgi:hypothetical protein